MREVHLPRPVKLFVGMLSNNIPLFEELKNKLEETFGPIDMESPIWQWDHTDYYSKEMGGGLKRKFIFFQKLINPEIINEIKLKTIELEKQYLNNYGRRRINLDPGYLDTAKLVLVSTKNYSHRIYLGKGIYGEVTLTYSHNAYHPLPYTYPDFRTGRYLQLFKKARQLYKTAFKSPLNYPGE
jgi:hypothetical protein